jgi:hypothetical protein
MKRVFLALAAVLGLFLVEPHGSGPAHAAALSGDAARAMGESLAERTAAVPTEYARYRRYRHYGRHYYRPRYGYHRRYYRPRYYRPYRYHRPYGYRRYYW